MGRFFRQFNFLIDKNFSRSLASFNHSFEVFVAGNSYVVAVLVFVIKVHLTGLFFERIFDKLKQFWVIDVAFGHVDLFSETNFNVFHCEFRLKIIYFLFFLLILFFVFLYFNYLFIYTFKFYFFPFELSNFIKRPISLVVLIRLLINSDTSSNK